MNGCSNQYQPSSAQIFFKLKVITAPKSLCRGDLSFYIFWWSKLDLEMLEWSRDVSGQQLPLCCQASNTINKQGKSCDKLRSAEIRNSLAKESIEKNEILDICPNWVYPILPRALMWTKNSFDKCLSDYLTYLFNYFGHFKNKLCS